MSHIITFYSYKGGTGRSMALANVAWILASAGKRILAIDWDLEAPGLHRYFQPFLTDKELGGQESQGVIDMVIDFAVRAATPDREGEQRSHNWYEAHADFSKWRQKLRWPSGQEVRLGKEGTGEIDFVPAGRQDANYARRVNHFDWHSFYEKLGGGAFFDEVKRKLSAYDYVLIDSRTGVSDTSGICTMQMPDTLVVCFTLNYQSIMGAFAVTQSVKEFRPDMHIFPVPTRIDGSEEKLLNRMKSYAADLFSPFLDEGIKPADYWYSMEVPYFPRYAYAEKLALFEEQASISTSTLPSMERLSEYITEGSVRSAGPIPKKERIAALTEFEGEENVKRTPEKSSPASTSSEAAKDRVPLRIFISSSSQDRDIAVAVGQTFQKLSATLYGRIDVFLDFDSIDIGEDLRSSIQGALERSELLIVLYTGASVGGAFAGYEIGYFNRVMHDDVSRHNETHRRIVWLYFGKAPEFVSESQGIDLDIDAHFLSGSRDDYVRRVTESTERQDPFTRFLLEIAERVESGLSERVGINEKVRDHITREIVPDLRGTLFDLQRRRVGTEIFKLRTVEVELPAGQLVNNSIPRNARLRAFERAFSEVFGISPPRTGEILWGDLHEIMNRRGGSAPLSTIELTIIGAMSARPEYERITRTQDGRMFRVVVGQQTAYFGGRTTFSLYFVPIESPSGNRDVSILLDLINMAAKYNAILERQSPLSSESFRLQRDFSKAREMVGQLFNRLLSLEEETTSLGLDEVPIRFYSDQDLDSLISSRDKYLDSLARLMALATKILETPPGEFNPAAYQEFLDTLDSCRIESARFNAIVTIPALEKLKKAFVPIESSMP